MFIGISSAAAELWLEQDPTTYNALFVEKDGDYYFFEELPDWAYIRDQGPFYVDESTGGIYSITTRPSQDGELIGNMI